MHLKAHRDLKDSGQPWLGMVPAHWDVQRNGKLFTQRIEVGFPDLPVLEVSLKTGVRVRDLDASGGKQVMSDFAKYKCVRKGDVVYNMMRMWQGAVGVVPIDGLVSPAYVVARANTGTHPAYYNLLFHTPAYKEEVNNRSRGIVSDRNRLYWEAFKQLVSPVPPAAEQVAIVRFVEEFDRRTLRFIKAKRDLIELLVEQKQAIVTHAATRGLNTKAKLKPSGNKWLGDVPQHWDVRRLRNIARLLVSNVDKHTRAEELHVRLCNYVDVYKNRRISGQLPFMEATASLDEIKRFRIRRGDVIITKDSETWTDIAVPALVDFEADDLVCGYHLAILRPRPVVRGAYLMSALLAKPVTTQFHIGAKGVTRYGLSHAGIKDVVLPLPPLEEQDAIVAAVDVQSKEIERTIAVAKREIGLIREYRARLLADVVTGKIDARGAISDDPIPVETKPTANVHFRRSVFAVEIIHRLHAEPTFGHVKFEKLIFLCEKRCGIDTGSTYHRQERGPYDSWALRSIDSQIKRQKWYEARKGEKGYHYISLEKSGAHRIYFDRYFANVAATFDEVIETFRTFNTERCEIVATLYSAWEDLLAAGTATDDQIIGQILNHWHPSKKKIEEQRWRKALEWMRQRGFVPQGA